MGGVVRHAGKIGLAEIVRLLYKEFCEIHGDHQDIARAPDRKISDIPATQVLEMKTLPREDETVAERRSTSAAARLCAGIFLLYQRETGARESDLFIRDEKTWLAFEQAALLEMFSYQFFDRSNRAERTPSSVLADLMGQIWLAETLPNALGTPATIQVITELANRLAAGFEIIPVDRRKRCPQTLGIDIWA